MKEVMSSSVHMGVASSSAPPKVCEKIGDVRPQKLMTGDQKSYYKVDETCKEDMCTFNNTENGVQGLSGVNIQEEEEEEDLLSDDIQGEYHAKLDNTQVHETDLVKCSARKRRDGNGELPQNSLEIIMESCRVSKGFSEEEQGGKRDSIGEERQTLSEVGKGISELQVISETRHSEKLQDQLVRNIQRRTIEV
jgi:hypothetical protein